MFLQIPAIMLLFWVMLACALCQILAKDCSDSTYFQLTDPPYENYFYSNCNASSHVVVTSPLPDSNLTIIGPRLLVAWPAGNSGVVAYFAPDSGENGTLAIAIDNSTSSTLKPVYRLSNLANPHVGISGLIRLNTSATLTVAILGSIRTIRDFTEGPSILVPAIQNSTNYTQDPSGSVTISRIWLDNVTETTLVFSPGSSGKLHLSGKSLSFDDGIYNFSASFNYPQLKQLSSQQVVAPSAQSLISQQPDQIQSLSFLSYTDKLLAGAWRFLTYFGRDSMISLLLLQPILSEGEGGAIEAVIGAVLERINRTDGSVCHEETIGDYATYLNLQANKTVNVTSPSCDYKMIDSDYYLPIAVRSYFADTAAGKNRTQDFFSRNPTENPDNANLTYGDLLLINAEKIMNSSAPFFRLKQKQGLIHLKDGQVVGQWRDSTYGIGGGRIPYDVNTALVPAALRAIAALSSAGFFPNNPDWMSAASEYAQVWEDETLPFFEVLSQFGLYPNTKSNLGHCSPR